MVRGGVGAVEGIGPAGVARVGWQGLVLVDAVRSTRQRVKRGVVVRDFKTDVGTLRVQWSDRSNPKVYMKTMSDKHP